MTERELMRRYNRVLEMEARLNSALGSLSEAASQIYGQELIADLCGGSEIEFRFEDDYASDSCIRIEELIDILNN